jgi:hypothetical protein
VRKWKIKLKDWGFDKYNTRSGKRCQEEGPETISCDTEIGVDDERRARFKRKRIHQGGKEYEVASADADASEFRESVSSEAQLIPCDRRSPCSNTVRVQPGGNGPSEVHCQWK